MWGRVAVWCWVLGWVLVLWRVSSPWQGLGGLVDERLRWLARLSLWTCPTVGYALGRLAGAGGTTLASKARRLRGLLYPPAVLVATAMAGVRLVGGGDAIGVLLTAWLAYTAGAATGALRTGGSREAGDVTALPEAMPRATRTPASRHR